MVGEETSGTVKWAHRRERARSTPLVLARAAVPSLLVHLIAAWVVLGMAPGPTPEANVDARLDGSLTVVTIETQPAEEPEPADGPAEAAEATADPEEDIACCEPAAPAVPRRTRAKAQADTTARTDRAFRTTDTAFRTTDTAFGTTDTAFGTADTAPTTEATKKTGAATMAAEVAPVREELAHPPAGTPEHVSPGVAASLRVYDTFPRMPEPLRRSPQPHLVVMNVCVSADGRVDDVRFGAGADPMLARTLREAVNTWRYRPLMLAEGPKPFCHEMGVRYRVR